MLDSLVNLVEAVIAYLTANPLVAVFVFIVLVALIALAAR